MKRIIDLETDPNDIYFCDDVMPSHFITMGQALVETYGEEQALKQIEDNLVMLMRSRSILVEHEADVAIKLNLAQQIDMWEQIKKSIG